MFELNELKYARMNENYNLEDLWNWILDNVDLYVGTEEDDEDHAYALIDDLFEGSSYKKIPLKDGRWISAYNLREEFRRNDR